MVIIQIAYSCDLNPFACSRKVCIIRQSLIGSLSSLSDVKVAFRILGPSIYDSLSKQIVTQVRIPSQERSRGSLVKAN